MKIHNCCLCSQIAGEKAGDLISTLLQEDGYIRRVAFESENFVVIPSLGAITLGHVLVCPKKHVSSYARLGPEFNTLSKDALLSEWNWLSTRLVDALETLYRAPVHRFEHGSGADGSHVACTVDHAHFHFLPARIEVLPALLSDPIWLTTSHHISEWTSDVGEQEYLFYQSPEGDALLAAKKDRYESQHMRRVFARALNGDPDWNWRSNPKPMVADQMFRDIAGALQ